ncbi:MAG: trp operon repressor [Holosporales bacterium]|jgi:TrpR-related protein YerC/YecD|nr:trp operon repressor [Holosporales bacterium]
MRQKNSRDLYAAMALLTSAKEVEDFLTDLCTPAEIKAFSERWRVCQILDRDDCSYRDIRKNTGVSLATISRVARFLKHEKYGGYRKMLEKIAQMERKS